MLVVAVMVLLFMLLVLMHLRHLITILLLLRRMFILAVVYTSIVGPVAVHLTVLARVVATTAVVILMLAVVTGGGSRVTLDRCHWWRLRWNSARLLLLLFLGLSFRQPYGSSRWSCDCWAVHLLGGVGLHCLCSERLRRHP